VLADVQHIDLTPSPGNGIERVMEEIRRRIGNHVSAQAEQSVEPPEKKKRMTQNAHPAAPSEAAPPRDFPLPPPFEWCNVSAGYVTLEDASGRGGTKGGRYWVEAFALAKYPVTNAQYDVFADDPDGYMNSGWWDYSPEAQQWRKEHPKPRGSVYGGSDLPCTNISWYEAIAFCYWLAYETGLEVVLPTEQQWQRAAQGDDGWEYPWGNEFDPNCCNHGNNVGRPTPVARYATGASPYGVMDMSGNVWEWCLTEWGTDSTRLKGNGVRVVRGGSWGFYQSLARAAARNWHDPRDWAVNQGFRIAVTRPIKQA
jgi:formylglycine-generating enzyme required for sulfatase activity